VVETKYQSPYKEYLKAREDMTHGINTGNAQQFILLLDNTIKAEPDSFHARCIRGFILTLLKDYPNAEKEFKIVEELKKDFRWLLLYKSFLFACQDKIDKAVDLLNQALAKSPDLKSEAENLAKYFTEYKKVVEKQNAKLPGDK